MGSIPADLKMSEECGGVVASEEHDSNNAVDVDRYDDSI